MVSAEKKASIALLLVALALFSPPAAAQKPRIIRVVVDNDYAPFVFRSEQGELQGVLIDQWRAWEQQTGIKAEIHSMDWDQALRRMRGGQFDVIESIFKTPERSKYFDFTAPYATVGASIFFHHDISGI